MKHSSYFLIALSFAAYCCSTSRLPTEVADFAQSKVASIASINPNDTDFKDLESVGNAIGDSRVVMLGEASHGDGSAFLAKSRLVKYLHEQKGFDVLAFEADFIALNQLTLSYADVHDSLAWVKEVTSGINPVWSATEECSELLFSYLPQTQIDGNPLHITGFDTQLYGLALGARDSFYKLLEKWEYLDLPNLKSDVEALVSCALKPTNELMALDTELASQLHRLDSSISRLMTFVPDKSSLEFRVLQNLKDFGLQILHFSDNDFYSFRDSCMAENIKWLLDTKFTGKKMIVWAANSHISKYPTNFKVPFTSMGTYLVNQYGEDAVYALAITAREGISGVFKATRVIESHKEGFENAVPGNLDYAFFDFNQLSVPQDSSFYMNAFGGGPVRLRWQKHFDGVCYIKEMAASTKGRNRTSS